jgi:hypothetical protein
MKFEFEVANSKKHRVSYERNWFSGKCVVHVDSECVSTKSPLNLLTHFSVTLSHSIEFPVGDIEKHDVRIERVRPLFLAGFRKHIYRAFVNGSPTLERHGY